MAKTTEIDFLSFTGEFYRTFKDLIPILVNLFQKIEEVGDLPNIFHEISTTLMPKPEKDTTKRENYLFSKVSILDENMQKSSTKY